MASPWKTARILGGSLGCRPWTTLLSSVAGRAQFCRAGAAVAECPPPRPEWQQALETAIEEIASASMPFGRFGPARFPPRGVPLYDLPVEYLLVLQRRGFPGGRLGELLALVCQVKLDGAEAVFQPLREANGGRHPLRLGRQRVFDLSE